MPIDPWYIGGPVIKGFGRGSKVLGIPTGFLLLIACAIPLPNNPRLVVQIISKPLQISSYLMMSFPKYPSIKSGFTLQLLILFS